MDYDILVIDPPWNKKKGGLRKERPNQKRNLDYSTLPTKELFSLLDTEIFTLAKETHVVFMWTIEKFLSECDENMLDRGYRRHVRMIWDKTNGVAPAFTVRYSHEYLIWYYKPKFLTIDKTQRGKFCSVFTEKGRQHSRKPDIAYETINLLYPNHSKIDVFSREKRNFFDQWGDEINFFAPHLADGDTSDDA